MMSESPKPVISLRPDGPAHVTIVPKSYLGGDLFASFRRCIEGTTYDPNRKTNRATVDKLPAMVEKLKRAGFAPVAPAEVHAKIASLQVTQTANLVEATKTLDTIALDLARRGQELYKFQREGVAWLAPRFGALLADEMGLGKTIQALAALAPMARVLVVCPAAAKGTWRKEAAKWRPEFQVSLLSGRGVARWPLAGEIVVINYDIASAFPGEVPADVTVICDEAHMLKNPDAKRTKSLRAAIQAVLAKGGRCWGLTGTPLLNRPQELWGVLMSLGLAQVAFGSSKNFRFLFNAKMGKWGTVWGSPVQPEVKDRLDRVMLRRRKADVLPDLPTKSWELRECTLDKPGVKALGALAEVFRAWLDSEDSGELPGFEGFASVRAALAAGKIPAMLDTIEEFETNEVPLLVWSAHRAPIDVLQGREGWAVITGDTSAEERSRLETRFQAGELKGLGLTIQAGGVALTLTHASNAIFVDRLWTPALNQQSEDRIMRIGQKSSVRIIDLVTDHPLDKRLHTVLMAKQVLIQATLQEGLEG
jgi:SWI/SNF-related matrix-associated actin-dependent regulator 1 of chromatin subfamily A